MWWVELWPSKISMSLSLRPLNMFPYLAKGICRGDSSYSNLLPSHVFLSLGNGASVAPFTQARVILVYSFLLYRYYR